MDDLAGQTKSISFAATDMNAVPVVAVEARPAWRWAQVLLPPAGFAGGGRNYRAEVSRRLDSTFGDICRFFP
jgi:hypothetical protein